MNKDFFAVKSELDLESFSREQIRLADQRIQDVAHAKRQSRSLEHAQSMLQAEQEALKAELALYSPSNPAAHIKDSRNLF